MFHKQISKEELTKVLDKHIDVSIILPVYNGESTLENSINSLLQQTYGNFELIICDDGSSDSSLKILNNIADPRIKIITNDKNYGLAYTLNKLISCTSNYSKYIAMSEQDDYYYPDRIEVQKYFLDKNKEYGMISGIAEHWNGSKVTMKFPGLLVNGGKYPKGHEMFKLNYREQLKVVNSCLMLRRSVHFKNKLFWSEGYPSISVDWDYILRFSLIANIYGINKVLVRLNRSLINQSLTQNKKLQHHISRELIHNFYKEFPSLISKEDYNYAKCTQNYLELKKKKHFFRLVSVLFIIMKDPDRYRANEQRKIYFRIILDELKSRLKSSKI